MDADVVGVSSVGPGALSVNTKNSEAVAMNVAERNCAFIHDAVNIVRSATARPYVSTACVVDVVMIVRGPTAVPIKGTKTGVSSVLETEYARVGALGSNVSLAVA
jgi:hypothetical protein